MTAIKLTENEKNALETLQVALECWIGEEGHSDTTVADLAYLANTPVSSMKGVVGSLVRKGILCVYEQECDGQMFVAFENQVYLTMDKITEIINNG
jgi:hypothetical protein